MNPDDVAPVPQVVDAGRQDGLLRFLQIGTAVLTLVVVILGLITLVEARTGADNSGRVQESTDLAACRSLARIPIDEARTEIESLILEGLSASARGELDAVVLLQAEEAQSQLIAATAQFKSAIERSTVDPAGFLEDCHRNNPQETTP